MKYEVGKTNRLGNRNTNQDRFAILERSDVVLLLLADGMGGYKGGELAANTFILKMTEAFTNSSFPIDDVNQFLHNAFNFAHLSIIEMGKQQTPPIQPRSTGVACLIQNGVATWAHVGDSRLYIFRNNNVFLRTRDHSVVEELIAKGKWTEENRLKHPKINQVTRCVGGKNKSLPLSIGEKTELIPGDHILLCSDGLWSSITEAELITQIQAKQTLGNKLNAMSESAEKTSYPNSDNITAVAFEFLNHDKTPSKKAKEKLDPETTQANQVLDEIREALEKITKDLK